MYNVIYKGRYGKMLLKCINNDLCSTLTLNKEYYVLEETSDYYVVIDDEQNETTCKKSR